MSHKMSRNQFLLIVLIIGSILTYLFIQDKKIQSRSFNIGVNGRIDYLEYDENGYPAVTVLNKVYYLPFANNGQLKEGDSIVKEKRDNVLYQYRDGKVINSFEGSIAE